MKKLSIFGAILCIVLSTGLNTYAKGDWRKGIWNRDVAENLFSLNIEAVPVISDAFKPTTPWAAGFNLGYEYKMRPSIIHGKVTFGFGGHLGLSRYFGKDINTEALGADLEQLWDSYKSYTEIPILLNFNMYYNLKRSNIFVGISAGVNLMLGERDAALNQIGPSSTAELEAEYLAQFGNEVNIISIQKSNNDISLTHVVPTFRFMVGYTYEFSQDWSLRIKAGAEYQMKYEDEYKGFHLDSDYYEFYHQHDSPQMLNPFISVGLVYSL